MRTNIDRTEEHIPECRAIWALITPGTDTYIKSQRGGDLCPCCLAYQRGREDAADAVANVEDDICPSHIVIGQAIAAARGDGEQG